MAYYNARSIIKEGFGAITASVVISIFAGAVLDSRLETFLALPALLALVPPLNDMAGDFGCIIGARLSTALHLGYVEPKIFQHGEALRDNMIAIFIVGFFSSIYLGVATYLVCYFGGMASIDFWKMVGISFLSGMVLVIITTFSGIVAAVLSYRYELDPSNVTIPIVTAVGDIVGVSSLILAARLFGVV